MKVHYATLCRHCQDAEQILQQIVTLQTEFVHFSQTKFHPTDVFVVSEPNQKATAMRLHPWLGLFSYGAVKLLYQMRYPSDKNSFFFDRRCLHLGNNFAQLFAHVHVAEFFVHRLALVKIAPLREPPTNHKYLHCTNGTAQSTFRTRGEKRRFPNRLRWIV